VLTGYEIEANGLSYQAIVNLSEEFLKSHPEFFDVSEARYSHYNLAFEFKHDLHRILIAGAGTGNNAAAALRHKVEQVDCVEIDPQIYALGKELHPEHPYDSPRVRMYLTDARAFLKQASGPYDLIWFGLLDTHPGSSYNNRRVDHYVYTLQCLQEARRLLASDGILLMNFASRRPWISDRLYGMLTRVFGHKPLAFQADRGAPQYGAGGELTLVGGNQPITVDSLKSHWLRDYVTTREIRSPGTTRPTTDDRPYLYLEHAKIPKLHMLTSLTILGTVILAQWRVFGLRRSGLDCHFFALGAAFLLLEVQTVSRATLLFGMTWMVNAIVISAVLVMILLANLVAWRWPRVPQWAITVATLALIPLDRFNTYRREQACRRERISDGARLLCWLDLHSIFCHMHRQSKCARLESHRCAGWWVA
jgi:spermidine synthase